MDGEVDTACPLIQAVLYSSRTYFMSRLTEMPSGPSFAKKSRSVTVLTNYDRDFN